MSVNQLRLPIQQHVLQRVLREHGVVRASVFGSYARGDATPESDLDLLVELQTGRSYLDLGSLQYELSRKIPSGVDVVLESSLRKRIRPYIEREKVEIQLGE